MSMTFAANLTKMIDAGLGGELIAPDTSVAVGLSPVYTEIGPAPLLTFQTETAVPIKALSVDMLPIQNLNGQDYPWPAGGGKNLFDGPSEPFTHLGITFTPDSDGSIIISGPANTTAAMYVVPLPFDIPEGTPVTISLNNESVNSEVGARLLYYRDSPNRFGTPVLADTIGKTATVTEVFTATHANLFVKSNHGAVSDFKVKIQFEIGSEATEWTPYANICPISGHYEVNIWRNETYDETADPVITYRFEDIIEGYIGILDPVNGILNLTMGILNMGNLTWITSESNIFVTEDLAPEIKPGTMKLLCSQYRTVNSIESDDNAVITCSGGNVIVKDTAYSDAATFAAAMDGVQLCFEFVEPTGLELTPQKVKTLIGTNNVWSDGGDVTLTYATMHETIGY